MKNKFIKILMLAVVVAGFAAVIPEDSKTVALPFFEGDKVFAGDINEKKRDYLCGLECKKFVEVSDEKKVCFVDKRKKNAECEELFKKTVTINFVFSDNDKEVIKHTTKITFTYDKKDFVKIAECKKDVTHETTVANKTWQSNHNWEILPSENECTVSDMCTIYKKSDTLMPGPKKYFDSDYIDITCTKDGKIRANTEICNQITTKGEIDFGKTIEKAATKTFDNLPDGITKKAILKHFDYVYDNIDDSNTYKYKTVRHEQEYRDKNGILIASAYMDANFRFNKKTKEARCISTSTCIWTANKDNQITVTGRTLNMTHEKGAGFGEVVYSLNSKIIDKCKLIIMCDYNGQIALE